jgi:carboxyl-terminal processing protease
MYIILFFLCITGTIHSHSEYNIRHHDNLSSWAQSLAETLHITQQKYYFDVPLKDSMVKMLDAFVHFDDHSRFLGPDDYKDLLRTTNGSFYGIGVLIAPKKIDDDYMYILDTIKNGPADTSGLKKHDKIIAIDEKSVEHLSGEACVRLLKSDKKESPVIVTFLRNDKIYTKTIYRNTVKQDHISSYYIADYHIGYCSLSLFTQSSVRQCREVIKKMNATKGIKGIILDLRDNAGGVLQAGVECAGMFVNKGTPIVYTKDKYKNIIETFHTTSHPLYIRVPVIILVNHFTASAAEILAGALSYYSSRNQLATKKNHYIFLMGTQTYGKGSVQEVIPIAHDCALKLTTCLYYLPDNSSIQEKGISPDFICKLKKNPDNDTEKIHELYGKERGVHHSSKDMMITKKRSYEKQDWDTQKKESLCSDYHIQNSIHALHLLDIAHTYSLPHVHNHTTAHTYIKKHMICNDCIHLKNIL